MSAMEGAIVGCWIAFIAFWAVTAFRTKQTRETRPLLSHLAHSAPILVGSWLLLKDPGALGDRVVPHTPVVVALGLALTVFGLWLALWARTTLGRNWSARVTFKVDHELIRRGPYAHVRHPIYSAILLMLVGSAIAIGGLGGLIGMPLIVAGIWLKLRQEEELMTRHFPEEYPSYRSTVGALIPRL